MPQPSAPSASAISAKRRSTSGSVEALVGSSMTITPASRDRALAISMSCCVATGSSPTSRRGSTSSPGCSSNRRASRSLGRVVDEPPRTVRSRPRKMLSATLIEGTSESSW